MSTFQKVKLGEVCPIIFSGGTPNTRISNYWNGGIPWLSSGETRKDFIRKTEKKISEEAVKNSSTRLAKKNDVIIATAGQGHTRGQASFLMIDSFINQSLIAFRPNKDKLNSLFLFYILRLRYDEIRSLSDGSSIRGSITGPLMKNLDLYLPDNINEQKVIVKVIFSYDQLIENNEKRIKILEEMAQNIYTEWFVKFKFPGYEKVKMVDSKTSYGKIPEGWDVKKLKQIGKVITGKTPPTSNLENFSGEVLFIKTPDIHGNIFILETQQNLSLIGSNTQALKLLPEKTVIVSCIGTLGIVGITSKPSQTNQQINALILNDNADYCFYYIFAKGLKQQLTGLGSNGATMGNVNKDKFENIKIIYPSEEVRKVYFNITSNLFDEILLLQKQNKNLSQARDLLIPQLVTGKRELKYD